MAFDWDDANREHIAEHGVTTDEAEYVVLNDPLDLDLQVVDSEERFVQVGATAQGRVLRVVTTMRGAIVRVVTAYDAPRRDRLAYEYWRVN
jgi:uncharacterized DUF497 family protein